MAKTTGWTAADPEYPTYWDVSGNWTDGVAETGDTVRLDSSTEPTDNRPTEGTFNFIVPAGVSTTPGNWLSGASVGAVDVEGTGYAILSNLTMGTLTVAAGAAVLVDNVDVDALVNAGTVQVNDAGLDVIGETTNSGTIFGAGTVVFGGDVTNTGTLQCSTLDFNGPNGLLGSGGTIGAGSIVTLYGVVNLTSCNWNVAADSTLTVDLAGTVNLGTSDPIPNLTVTIATAAAQTVTLAGAPSVRGFTLNTSGTLAGGGVTLTLGAGAYTSTLGTVTGILNVALGAGGITYTAGDYTGATFNVTVPVGVTTTVCNWNTTTSQIATLTVNGTATANGAVRVKALAGSDPAGARALAMGANTLAVYPAADNFYTFTGTLTGTGTCNFVGGGNYSNAGLVKGPTGGATWISGLGAAPNKTLTLNGGLTCGALTIFNYAITLSMGPGNLTATTIAIGLIDNAGTLTMGSGNLSCTAITIGGTGTGKGILNLGSSRVACTTIAAGGAGAAHEFNGGSSRINLGGSMTLAGCTVNLGTAAIKATADVTIDGTGATSIVAAGADLFANGHTLTLDDLGALNARGWNGPTLTGTTAMEHHPGAPSALGLMGCGV